jgi:hypothetical protein
MASFASATYPLARTYGVPNTPEQPAERASESVITTGSTGRTRIRAMSESSLLPFGPVKILFILKYLRPTRLKEALEGLYTGRRRRLGATRTPKESRAVRYVREYLDVHAASIERAVRLEEKAARLERAGIPSESARKRAERAHREVVSELTSLRASFVEATGEREGYRAFDRAVKHLCPAFALRRFPNGIIGNASTGAPGGAPLARL